jgi:glycosyltransferase involved in cell wall biosynthesis
MTVSTDSPHSVDPYHQPLVSVLVPSYQAGPYLAFLVESVRAQTYQCWELLILDDGSGDLDHPDVVDVLADNRIRAFRWSPNRGVSQATRFLMEEARGDFWCYPGADDILLPQFIEKRLAVLDRHHDVSLVFGRGGQIDTAGNEIWFDLGRKTFEQMKPLEEQVIEAKVMLDLLMAANIINTPSIFARSRATLPILTRYQMDWRYCQDWFYWLLLAANGCRFFYSGEILHQYRFHEQSLTQSPASWAWRNVEPALVLLTGLALSAQTGELGLRFYQRYRLEMIGNWLVRSAKFRRHPYWCKWASTARLANIHWFEWPQAVWMALQVLRQRRLARRNDKVLHGLPSAYFAHPFFD